MPKKTNKTTPSLKPSFNELRGGPHEPEVWMVMDELSGYYPKTDVGLKRLRAGVRGNTGTQRWVKVA